MQVAVLQICNVITLSFRNFDLKTNTASFHSEIKPAKQEASNLKTTKTNRQIKEGKKGSIVTAPSERSEECSKRYNNAPH